MFLQRVLGGFAVRTSICFVISSDRYLVEALWRKMTCDILFIRDYQLRKKKCNKMWMVKRSSRDFVSPEEKRTQ